MEIDLISFSPLSSLIGGVLIGIAVNIFFIVTGKLAGVSGIINNFLFQSSNRSKNIFFILGLIIGPYIFILISNNDIPFKMTTSIHLIIISGFLVGIGTKISNGCTSGHGVCGISLLSLRSILATLTFIISGVITVIILKLLGVGL